MINTLSKMNPKLQVAEALGGALIQHSPSSHCSTTLSPPDRMVNFFF